MATTLSICTAMRKIKHLALGAVATPDRLHLPVDVFWLDHSVANCGHSELFAYPEPSLWSHVAVGILWPVTVGGDEGDKLQLCAGQVAEIDHVLVGGLEDLK